MEQKKKSLVRRLDNLVGNYFRSMKECQAAGYENILCKGRFEWCHIKSRRYYSVRWSLNNGLCLCSNHHRYYTNNPDAFIRFINREYPGKINRLRKEFRTVCPMREMDLQEKLDKLQKVLL